MKLFFLALIICFCPYPLPASLLPIKPVIHSEKYYDKLIEDCDEAMKKLAGHELFKQHVKIADWAYYLMHNFYHRLKTDRYVRKAKKRRQIPDQVKFILRQKYYDFMVIEIGDCMRELVELQEWDQHKDDILTHVYCVLGNFQVFLMEKLNEKVIPLSLSYAPSKPLSDQSDRGLGRYPYHWPEDRFKKEEDTRFLATASVEEEDISTKPRINWRDKLHRRKVKSSEAQEESHLV